MAAYRKRNNRWNVQIRKIGIPLLSKTFSNKKDAQIWAVEIEKQIENGNYFRDNTVYFSNLGDLLRHYRNEVTPHKRCSYSESCRINKMIRDDIARLSLKELSSIHIARYRTRRLTEVSKATVKKELQILSHVLDLGRKEWGLNKANVVRDVKKPIEPKGRDRRLEQEELKSLLKILSTSENHKIKPLVEIALETGMRRGELLSLKWSDVDLHKQTAHLPMTKNGSSRTVPLSTKAIEVLTSLPRDMSGIVFTVSPYALRGVWRRATKRAGIKDLRFHDLRHEATSRFFEKGLNVMEVAAITGHKDLRMLQRYTHLRAEDLAKKLG